MLRFCYGSLPLFHSWQLSLYSGNFCFLFLSILNTQRFQKTVVSVSLRFDKQMEYNGPDKFFTLLENISMLLEEKEKGILCHWVPDDPF